MYGPSGIDSATVRPMIRTGRSHMGSVDACGRGVSVRTTRAAAARPAGRRTGTASRATVSQIIGGLLTPGRRLRRTANISPRAASPSSEQSRAARRSGPRLMPPRFARLVRAVRIGVIAETMPVADAIAEVEVQDGVKILSAMNRLRRSHCNVHDATCTLHDDETEPTTAANAQEIAPVPGRGVAHEDEVHRTTRYDRCKVWRERKCS